MARLPKVRLVGLTTFPASVSGGTAIDVTKTSGAYTISLDVSDIQIAAVPTEDEDTTYAISWGGVTDDNPAGAFQLVPFTGLQAASADLTSLAELGTIGIVARTADATYATRTITAGTGIGITNGGGIAGNPTVAITDAELLALAGLTSAADKLPYFTGSGTAALADFTTFGRSLVDDADASAARTTLGLTSPATTTPAALTRTSDTNVTLTLGGTPTTALLQATSITVGWSGTLAASRGGFGADVSASSGVPLFAAGTPTFTSTNGTGVFIRQTAHDAKANLAGGNTFTGAQITDTYFETRNATPRVQLSNAAGVSWATFLHDGNDIYLENVLNGAAFVKLNGIVTHRFSYGSFYISGSTSGTLQQVAPAVAGSSVWTWQAGTDTVVGRATTDTLTNKTFNSAGTGNVLQVSGVTVSRGQFPGESTTGSATAGNIGEYVESILTSGSATSLTNNTAKTITSISLTAGDWDVSGLVYFLPANTTTATQYIISVSGTTNTLDATMGKLVSTVLPTTTFNGSTSIQAGLPPYRLSLSGTTTVYLIAQAAFGVSTLVAAGIIRARRMR